LRAWRRKLPPRRDRSEEFASYTLPKPRAAVLARVSDRVVAVPKEDAVRSEPYLRLVAALPCAHCGRAGPSQAAHADEGKGGMIKTDDRTAFPLCATRPGQAGCHDIIGASGAYTREERRELEKRYGAQTRATIIRRGLWPKSVPRW
jgi:hypothetical protein